MFVVLSLREERDRQMTTSTPQSILLERADPITRRPYIQSSRVTEDQNSNIKSNEAIVAMEINLNSERL